MKRTAMITAFFPPLLGGIENFLGSLAPFFPSKTLTVITAPHQGAARFDQVQDYSIIRKPLFSLWPLRPSWLPLLWRLPRVFRGNKIEQLIFGHYAPYGILGWYFQQTLGIPYHVMVHGVDVLLPQRSWAAKAVLRFTLRHANTCIANSRFLEQELLKLGMPKERIHIAYPSVPDTNPPRDSSRVLPDTFTLLSVSRLIGRKGIDTVLRALPAVRKEVPRIRYFIVGDGPERKPLEALSENLGIADVVTFIGSVPDDRLAKAPYYTAADVFVLPTKKLNRGLDVESFGIVYLEAFSYTKPVIASTNGGAQEIVDDGVNGYLIQEDDIPALVERIIRLAEDPALRKKFGAEGQAKVSRSFLWEQQWKKLQPLFA